MAVARAVHVPICKSVVISGLEKRREERVKRIKRSVRSNKEMVASQVRKEEGMDRIIGEGENKDFQHQCHKSRLDWAYEKGKKERD